MSGIYEVFCKGIAKGSGRTYGNIHLKYLLDKASDLLVGYGGHAAAAGMSIKIINISILQHRLKSYLKTEAGDTESTSFMIWKSVKMTCHL